MSTWIELTSTFGMSKTPAPVSVRIDSVTTFASFGAGTRLNFGEDADAGFMVVLEPYAKVRELIRE